MQTNFARLDSTHLVYIKHFVSYLQTLNLSTRSKYVLQLMRYHKSVRIYTRKYRLSSADTHR